MRTLSTDELIRLSEPRESPCVSIYMPSDRLRMVTQRNSITFKNLVSEVERQLDEWQLAERDKRKLLRPAHQLIDDTWFWQHQTDGFAIFLAPEFHEQYHLPAAVPEYAVVSHRFHIKPMLPLFTAEQKFYLLTLNLKGVTLYEGSRFAMEDVPLEDSGYSSFERYLERFQHEKHGDFHTRAPRSGSPGAVFYGHGPGAEEDKQYMEEYLRQLDNLVRSHIRDHNAPMLLAGVEYTVSMYRQVNNHPHLLDEWIAGSPEQMSERQLHYEAWQRIEPYFLNALRGATEHYHARIGTGYTANDLETILPAAYSGRIETLFIDVEAESWGRFDPETLTLESLKGPVPGSEDLIDLAAIQALRHGGTVYAVERNKLPDDTAMAAVFRF